MRRPTIGITSYWRHAVMDAWALDAAFIAQGYIEGVRLGGGRAIVLPPDPLWADDPSDVLDMLDNPNTPRALNYRGYATRKLGRTDEGISYYLKSVALDPAYAQVREYLGEAYVIQGKYDLAKDQLVTIEKLCGSKDCEYYEDLAGALEKAHAL